MRPVYTQGRVSKSLLRSGWLEGVASRGGVLAATVLLFMAIVALRTALSEAGEGTLVLFVVPIALCAVEFGVLGGLGSGLVALALLVGWDALSQDDLGLWGIATRASAFLLVGGLLGRLVDVRRALEAEVRRHYDLSLDLVCTAGFDGYFQKLNPAWEETLGHTRTELMSRPFIEFVHPDDRERTEAESAKLAEIGVDTISFRNRYRCADGTYRWLEWSARASANERKIYATARDITSQQQAEEALENQSAILERTVRERTLALEDARLETLQRLALAAEYRDDDTYEHTERVGRTAALIARQLGLKEDTAALLRRAAPLHDLGKIGVSDAILLKPGKLTPVELREMQKHVRMGAGILAGSRYPTLQMARQIALTHHERWDGGGYLQGLRGEAIPLSGRIVAVADVFDALTHERPYKKAWPLDEAVAEIDRLAGQHFDPSVVDAFAELNHPDLLEPIERYDLDLPPPPLTAPPEDLRRSPAGNGDASDSAVRTRGAT